MCGRAECLVQAEDEFIVVPFVEMPVAVQRDRDRGVPELPTHDERTHLS